MGRFYKTSVPEFVEDFIYQPPWELAQEVMKANEEGIQNTLGAASLLQSIDINYIPDPVEKAEVEELQKKYEDAASSLATNLQIGLQDNPQAWRKILPELSNLSSELNKDIKSGKIAKITQSYNNYTKWLEDNKDIKEKDPILYNAAQNALMREWQKNPNRSQDAVWQGVDLVDFDVNGEEIMKGLESFKADINTQVANGYITQVESLSDEKIAMAYMTKVLSDPKAQAYLQQAVAFGVPGFVDKEGKSVDIMIPVNTKTGEILSSEEYIEEKQKWEAMTPAEKSKQGMTEFEYKYTFNPEHPWARTFESYGKQKSYTQVKVDSDPTWNSIQSRAQQMQIHRENMENQRILAQMKIDAEKEKQKTEAENNIAREISKQRDIINKYGASSSQGKKAKEKIEKLTKAQLELDVQFFHNLPLEVVQTALAQGNDSQSAEVSLIRTIDGPISYGVIRDMKVSNEEKKFLESINSNLGVDKSGYFERQTGMGNLRKTIIDYLIKNGYKRDQLEKTVTTQLQSSAGAIVSSTVVDSPILKKYINLANNYIDNKRKAYQSYSEASRSLSVSPVTTYGEDKLRKELLYNTPMYSAIPMDVKDGDKIKSYDVSKIVKEGTILGVTENSPFNEGVVIQNNEGRKFLIVNNNTGTRATLRNRYIYTDPEMYENSDDYVKFENAAINHNATAIKNLLGNLNSQVNTYKLDYNRKDEKGNPKPYIEIPYSLENGNAIRVRRYPLDNTYEILPFDTSDNIPLYTSPPREYGETYEQYAFGISSELEGAISKIEYESMKK